MINIAEVFQLVIALLNEVEANAPTLPPDHTLVDVHLKHGYAHLHIKSLEAARHLCCLYHNELDDFYKSNKAALIGSSKDACILFDKMMATVENEMSAGLEEHILNPDTNETNNGED